MLGDVIIAEPKALIGFAGAARDRADDPAAAAAGLPARRVPARARHGRHDRQAQRDARDAGEPDCACSGRAAARSAARWPRSATPALLARLDGCGSLGVDFGLERVRRALGALGIPEQRLPAVHVAGTNGKGSTAAMTEAVLRAAGWRTGLYTSPHLCRFTERIRVDGVEVDGDRLARARRGDRRDRRAADLLRGRDGDGVPGLRRGARRRGGARGRARRAARRDERRARRWPRRSPASAGSHARSWARRWRRSRARRRAS